MITIKNVLTIDKAIFENVIHFVDKQHIDFIIKSRSLSNMGGPRKVPTDYNCLKRCAEQCYGSDYHPQEKPFASKGICRPCHAQYTRDFRANNPELTAVWMAKTEAKRQLALVEKRAQRVCAVS